MLYGRTVLFLHLELPATRSSPSEIDCVMKSVIRKSYYGKVFQLCSFRDKFLRYKGTKVRWLSRGNVLGKLFQEKSELLMYLEDEKSQYEKFLF